MRLINVLLICSSFFWIGGVGAENLNIQQVLQRVINHYPSIKTAALQVQRAKEENVKVESQLSWILNGNAGYARDTSLFGTATDRYSLAGSVNRNLGNGGLFGFNASVSSEDSEDTFGPTIPNPASKTRLDINYRHRFEKGAGNPQYSEGLVIAQANEKIALSNKLALYDELAAQVIELYLSAAITQARINNIDKTIDRGKRLKQFIDNEFKLGLSEDKDVLQVNARLSINEADKKSLLVIWQQQLIALNRLMGREWNLPLVPDTQIKRLETIQFDEIYSLTQAHNPALKRIEAQLQLADSAIRSSRDQRKDELDLLVFVGNEINQGDTATSDISESELIGGVSLEFNRGLDKSGVDAALRQAHYDRGIALQDKKQLLEDIQYDLSSLLAEVKFSEQALIAFRDSVKAEQKKLDEAVARYKNGRIETDRIIDFESQLANAELSYDLQAIELSRRYHNIDLIRGSIWKNLYLPEFTFDEYTQNIEKKGEGK